MNCRTLFVCAVLAMALQGLAAVPQLINYQGFLTDSDGSPLDTVMSITFRLYDAPSGGMQLWAETQPSCSLSTGLFHVLLGSVEVLPDSVFRHDALWLEVKVGSDNELVPRTFLASVPYAYRSMWADSITPKNVTDLLEFLNNLPDADQDGHLKLSEGGDDCNDWNATIYPGAQEICDGLDHDCDGIAGDGANNPGCTQYYADFDGDGYGDENIFRCLCNPNPPFTALNVGDCDDSQSSIHPGAPEICNGLDDDCDGAVDDTVTTPEICDGLDNDCDTEIDEGENNAGCMDFFFDHDGDGWGTFDSRCLCHEDGYYRTLNPGDCDDENPDVNPEMPEVCNGIDDNCDGMEDEDGAQGCIMYFWDQDDDGYGTEEEPPRCLCQPENLHRATQSGDCDDWDPEIHPGAPENCNNGLDDDCDYLTDGADPDCQ
jgi:hypothetical protein